MITMPAYMACQQIARVLLDGAILPFGIADGEHVELGVRSVRPDGRSNHDPSFRWPWPGNWTERVEADRSPAECSFGLHIALGWSALSALGSVHVVQVVAFRTDDVAHIGSKKIRVEQAGVLNIVDVWQLARDGFLYGANLYGANLYGADLTGANLTGANLTRADLYGANLTGADLTRANWDTYTRWPEGFTPPKAQP